MNSDVNYLNSVNMLEYIELEDENDEAGMQRAYYLNRIRNQSYYFIHKLRIKSGMAIIRLLVLYIFYYLDGVPLTPFLDKLITLLLIHEASVVSNYILAYTHFSINRVLYRNRIYNIPKFSYYLDVFNNFLFFVWFVYGNYCIIMEKDGVDESLRNNKMVTYYVTILVLLGFFIFSKLIFYIIFFVCFCPCITYVLCIDLHRSYQIRSRANILRERLKEEEYEKFTKRLGFELETCIICCQEFKNGDMIISLPCNNKHTFHSECIKRWIEQKIACPLCKSPIVDEEINN